MNLWLVMLACGALTFGTRLSFIYLLGRAAVPAWLREALKYVPPAVLSAIIFPELFISSSGKLALSLGNPRLLAGCAAALVAWRTKNAILTILTGMALLWLFQALL
jgi:branched-subunit amino acid transport protein